MNLTLARGAGRALSALFLALPALAFASGKYYKAIPLHPKFQQECGACHVPYQAGMLSAASWQRLMDNLKSHFGTNVTLDAGSAAQISDWLRANAGTSATMMGDPAEDRVTNTKWFKLEHHDFKPADWKMPAVKSASNCAACHAGSPRGIFDEHDAKVPR